MLTWRRQPVRNLVLIQLHLFCNGLRGLFKEYSSANITVSLQAQNKNVEKFKVKLFKIFPRLWTLLGTLFDQSSTNGMSPLQTYKDPAAPLHLTGWIKRALNPVNDLKKNLKTTDCKHSLSSLFYEEFANIKCLDVRYNACIQKWSLKVLTQDGWMLLHTPLFRFLFLNVLL